MAYGNYRGEWNRDRNERWRMRDRDNQYTQSDDDDSRLARDSMERDYYGNESGGGGRGGYGGWRGEHEEGPRYSRGYGQGDYDREYGQRESGQGARYSESGYGRGRESPGGRRHYGNEMGGWQGREEEQWRNRDVHGQYDTDTNYGGFSSSGTGNYRGYGGSGGSYRGGQGRWGDAGTQYGQGESQGDYNYRGDERGRYGQGSGQNESYRQRQGSGQRYGQSMRSYESGWPRGGRAYGEYGGAPSGNYGEELGSQGQGLDQYGPQGSQGRQWGQQEYGEHRGRGPRDYKRSDDRIREEVCDCLTDDDRLDATHIEVVVKDGEVTLSGFTTSREDKRWAESLAERISGVNEVQNSIRLFDQQRQSVGQGNQGSTQSSMQGTGASSAGTSGTRGGGDNKSKDSNIQH